jgi:hypothetical protein
MTPNGLTARLLIYENEYNSAAYRSKTLRALLTDYNHSVHYSLQRYWNFEHIRQIGHLLPYRDVLAHLRANENHLWGGWAQVALDRVYRDIVNLEARMIGASVHVNLSYIYYLSIKNIFILVQRKRKYSWTNAEVKEDERYLCCHIYP